MIKFVDAVVGLAFGDESKGAVIYELSKKPEYNVVLKTGGGSNCGHTIYHNNKKYVTHLIPTGVFHKKICIIGSECVINIKKLFQEIENLEKDGINVRDHLLISKDCHIVTEDHIKEEISESKIGSTRQGIGPCVRDKYSRIGVRAETCEELSDFVIDLYEFFQEDEFGILCECSQGFYLDISLGDYPFVTSGHTTVAGALLNCLPWNKVRKVYGVCKAYDTYVGSKQFQPDDEIFNELQELGQERGSTTGRKRQCNWLNLDNLIKAVNVNVITHLIISKMDILKQLNEKHDNKYWNVIFNGEIDNFQSEEDFIDYVTCDIYNHCQDFTENVFQKSDRNDGITWRYSPTDKVESNE